MERRNGGFCLLLLATVAGGCSTTNVSTNRAAPTGIALGESIAVVPWQAPRCKAETDEGCPGSTPRDSESEFDQCLCSRCRPNGPI